jgi:hypothetical protein
MEISFTADEQKESPLARRGIRHTKLNLILHRSDGVAQYGMEK